MSGRPCRVFATGDKTTSGKPMTCTYEGFRVSYKECKELCHEWNAQVPDPIASKPCLGFQTSADKRFHSHDECVLIRSANDWKDDDGNPCWQSGTLSEDGNYYAGFETQLCIDPFAPEDPNPIKCYGMFDQVQSCEEAKEEIKWKCPANN